MKPANPQSAHRPAPRSNAMPGASGRSRRTDRAEETRELILAAAERLFAQQGVATVSNRQISDAAGQGNNTAVGYHFGTKTDLVRAIVRRHTAQIERRQQELLARRGDRDRARDWVAILVRPVTEHLAAVDGPTWYARFIAQVMTDPALRQIVIDEALTEPVMQATIDGLGRTLPELPAEVRTERQDMARNLIVHVCAERERALADGVTPARPDWTATANGLIDAIVGLLTAPVTHE